jgi:hypothetical protein
MIRMVVKICKYLQSLVQKSSADPREVALQKAMYRLKDKPLRNLSNI